MRAMRSLLTIVTLVAFAAPGCGKKEQPKPAAEPKAAPAATTPAATPTAAPASKATPPKPTAEGRVTVADVTMLRPPSWTSEKPRSPMRIAQFRLPGGDGAEAAVMTVIAAGGSVDDNVTRWKGQFEGEAKVAQTDYEVAGMKITQVQMDGTFLHKARPMAPGPGTPKAGWSVLAAIVKTPKAQLFFKATGPAATIAANVGPFEAALKSLSAR